MAETIREVIIKTRIDVENADTVGKVVNAQKDAVKATKDQQKSVGGVNKLVKELLRQNKQLTDELRKQADLLDKQNAAMKRLTDQTRRKNAEESKGAPAGSRLGAAFGKVNSGVGLLAAGVGILSIGPRAIGGMAQAVQRGNEAAQKRGEQRGGFLDIVSGLAETVSSFLGIDKAAEDIVKAQRGGPLPERVQLQTNREKFIGASEKLLQELLKAQTIRTRLNQDQLTTLKEQLQEARSTKQILEKQVKESAQEFGLLGALDQQTVNDIAQRISAGGTGSVSKQELEFLKQFGFSRGFLGDVGEKQAKQSPLFSQFQDITGERRRLQEASQNALNLESQVNLIIGGKGSLIEQLQKSIDEAMLPLIERKLNDLQFELKHAATAAAIKTKFANP